MNERNKNPIENLMMPRSGMTREQRYSLNITNPAKGDKVSPERIENPLNLQTGVISTYLEFASTTTPLAAPSNNVRLYTKPTGSASKLFVIDSTGTEKELLTSASFSLDGAYNIGSTIAVDATDVKWQTTGTLGMYVQNSTGATDYWSANSSAITHSVPTSLLATTTVGTTNKIQFRDTAIYISSKNDGYLDLDADTAFRFNTGLVGINKAAPAAYLDIAESALTGAVVPSQLITGAAHTALTAGTERNSMRLNFSATQQFATGAITDQRAIQIDSPTYGFVGASTITDAYGVWVSGAPTAGTNATLTETHGLFIGAANVGAGSTTSYGLSVNAQTGGTTNYAAQFLGGLTVHAKGIKKTKATATIAAGVITYASGYMEIDTQGGAATDDLDTISPGIAEDGTEVIIKSANATRVPTLKDGTGNLRLNGDFIEDSPQDRIVLQYDGTNWCELSRSNNA